MKKIITLSILFSLFFISVVPAQITFDADTVFLTNTGVNGEYEGVVNISATNADIGDLQWDQVERTIEPLVWNAFVYTCDSVFFPFSVEGPITRAPGINNCFIGANITNLEGGLPRATNQFRLRITSSTDPGLNQELAFILNPVPVSTKFISPSNLVAIAPNPVQDQLHVKLEKGLSSQKGWCRVYDFQGKRLQQEFFDQSDFVLSSASLSPGIYLLQLETEEHRIIKQFVKN